MSQPLGILCKIYRNTASYGSPSWSEVTIIADFTVNPTWDKADANSRESRVKRSVKTMLGLTFSGNLKKKPGETNYEAFMNALVSDNVLDLLILDGDKTTNSVRGWRCDCQVYAASEDQGMANRVYEAIDIEPTDSDNQPKAVLVTGGALTYSTPGEDGDTFA